LGYCTTLLRDSPFAVTGRGVGSAMGPAERARRWKDVKVQLADVRAGEDVGYIAVVEVVGSEKSELTTWDKEVEWREKLQNGERLYA